MDASRDHAVVLSMHLPARRPSRRLDDPPRADAEAVLEAEREALVYCRAAQGDEHAWMSIVAKHVDATWELAELLTQDTAAAAAVCELAWLRLAQALPLRAGEDVGRWLAKTVWNEAGRAAAGALLGRRRADGSGDGQVVQLPRPRGSTS